MQLSFDVDGQPAEFRRNQWTGRSELVVGDEVTCLESPYRLSTHFQLGTRTVLRHRVGDHEVEIEKVRPRVMGGVQSNSFTVSVDGDLVTTAHGT